MAANDDKKNDDKKPEIKNIPKVEMLFEENIETFNQLAKEHKAPNLRFANLSQMDLRKAYLKGMDLTGCYMRGCNLRGIDFTGCNMYGVSMQGAQISGALFPEDLPAEEIRLSVEVGTRMRHSPQNRSIHLVAELLTKLSKRLGLTAEEPGKS